MEQDIGPSQATVPLKRHLRKFLLPVVFERSETVENHRQKKLSHLSFYRKNQKVEFRSDL